jgi:hypothetical protein
MRRWLRVSFRAARRKLSFLGRAVVAGVRQAWHVEFDRVAAFVASDGNETTNYAEQGQTDTAHMSSPRLDFA